MQHAVTLFVAILGCSGSESPADTSTSVGSDTAAPPDADSPWQIAVLDGGDVGLQAELALAPGGDLVAAYWSNSAWEDGICEGAEAEQTPQLRHDLYLARSAGAAWSITRVDSPAVAFEPTGLDLDFSPDGAATIAYTGGTPEQGYCGGHDATLATEHADGWTFSTAASDSGQSATGSPASDAGFVVGLWPALAFDSAGLPAVLHKDAHFGAIQHDDAYRADAELAREVASGWEHVALDIGEGAGDDGALLFDLEDRPVAFFGVDIEAQELTRRGVWATRVEADGSLSSVQLHSGPTGGRISALLDDSSGMLVAAFYDEDDRSVRIRRLSAGADFADPSSWADTRLASGTYDEGRDPSLALTANGNLALAYHRCARLSDTDSGCDINDEAAIFAVEVDGEWLTEVIQEGLGASCGSHTSLVIDHAGVPHVIYRCTEEDAGEFSTHLTISTREG